LKHFPTMNLKTLLLTSLLPALCPMAIVSAAESPTIAANAGNALGLELLIKGRQPDANALLSPYSIQSALAMTYAGAAGDTRAEMARVLHYPADEAALHASFAALRTRLDEMAQAAARRGRQADGAGEPLTLNVANRLFGQLGQEFRPTFLALTADTYGAPFRPLDFETDPHAARQHINGWVAKQTQDRIRELIPSPGITRDTRLVLVNAIHLKAPWATPFEERATRPEPFYLADGEAVSVPTMKTQGRLGHRREDGFTVVTVPYAGGGLQLLLLLPDAVDGLAKLTAKLTPEMLADFAQAGGAEVRLQLPKFKLEPPMMPLGETLQTLGMRTAFDKPERSANFDRMAPRKPDDYLFISEVYHQTFLDLDEKGTEAAAATAVVMMRLTSVQVDPPQPVEVRVDRPFLFAIQHRSSGACLFLGRVVDPR